MTTLRDKLFLLSYAQACKHVLFALERARARFPRSVRETPYVPEDVCVYLSYGENLELGLLAPPSVTPEAGKLPAPFSKGPIRNVRRLLSRIPAIEALGLRVVVYPDAEEHISRLLYRARVAKLVREILLGRKPDAPEDESLKAEVQREAEALARKARIEDAGGHLVGAAFSFLGELLSGTEDTDLSLQAEKMLRQRLSECLERGEDGRLRMTIALPDEAVVEALSKTLAKVMTGVV